MWQVLARLHVVSFTVHLVSGALGAVLASDTDIAIPVYGNYVSYTLDGANAAAAFAKQPPQVAFRFNTLKAFTAVELITAGWQLLYGLELWLSLPDSVSRWTAHPLRWAEYAVTATLLTLSNLVATGGNDVVPFFVTLGSAVGLQACGLVSELAWRPRGSPDVAKDTTNAVANVQGCLLLFTVMGTIMAQVQNNQNADAIWTQQVGEPTVPPKPLPFRFTHALFRFAHALPLHTCASVPCFLAERRGFDGTLVPQVAAYGIYFLSFGVNAALRAFSVGAWADFLWTEKVYAVLSVTSKTSLFWLSTGATRQVSESRGFAAVTPGVEWDAVRYCAMALPGSLGVAYLLATYPYGRRDEAPRRDEKEPAPVEVQPKSGAPWALRI